MKGPPQSAWVVALVLSVFAATRFAAQEVTVGEPASLRPMGLADKLPTTFSRLHPAFPDELRALDEPGYVIATRYFDADRKILDPTTQGTHPLFERTVEEAARYWVLSSPAMRGRKRIPAHIWVPVIFNPKSAAGRNPDATPRLLAVAPIFIPLRPGGSTEPLIVRVRLDLNAEGAIDAITPVTPLEDSIDRAVRESLQKWRFAPARAAGQAVAASLTMPVCCQPIGADYLTRVPPKPVSRPSEYPADLINSGLRADVLVRFDVDAAGAVQNPVVVSSTNPAFDADSLGFVHEWKYEPATVDGRPVAAAGLRYTFKYDTRAGGKDAYTFYDNADQGKLPPQLRYDTPARLRGTLAPVYPYALRRDGVGGLVKAAVAVDTRGRVGGVKILSADQPELGLAVAAALEGFSFDPALKDGKPVPYLLNYEKKFERDDQPFDSGRDLLLLEKKHPERILSAAALDAPLKPITRRDALFPVTLPKGVGSGEALIEILVDTDGYARLPRIVTATDEAFGYAAVQAVSAWQFDPPLKNGKPVIARGKIPFRFTSQKTAAVEAAKE